MKLIYPPTITNMGRTIMCISYPRIWVGIWVGIWEGNHNQRTKNKDESNLGGRQMDNTNRKCIFGNDLLLGTQSNVGFRAAVAVRFFGHKLNIPYNCPFIHNVYLPCTSHKVLLNHYAAFCLDKF